MQIDGLITKAARQHGIPSKLLKAIVEVESAGDPWAVRYEPNFRWLWNIAEDEPWKGDTQDDSVPAPAGASEPTERRCQAMSFGLVQIMGATARELGFDGPFLTQLCDPELNLEYGCKYLKRLYRRFGGEYGWEGIAAAYNAGSPRKTDDGSWENQDYVDKVTEAGGL